MFPISFKGNSEFNVLYFSDVHNKTDNMGRFKTAVDEFDRENKNKNTLKLAGGDLNFASDLEPNILMLTLMKLIGLDASSIGNHEIEGGNYWAKAIDIVKPKFKFLSTNLNFTRPNDIEDKVAKSVIINRKGEKVGVVGVTAFDSVELNFKGDFNDFIKVSNFAKTALEVKKEVKQLEKQGINKIFLLAHTGEKSKLGFDYYKNLAKIGGIDVIIGGHDHVQRDKWYLSERGEPVKIVSTEAKNDLNLESEDLGTFGVLKATFDGKGVLIPDECDNKIRDTKLYSESPMVKKLEEKILQNNKVIAHLEEPLECNARKTTENPVADLLADSMLWIANKVSPQSHVQIALINSGELKADIPSGNITMKDIKAAYPFTHNVTIVEAKFTKKQLFDALNHGVETSTYPKPTLGLLQVGGLRYIVGSDNKVKDVYLINKQGERVECLDNAPNNKKYTVVYDTYLMQGAGGANSLKKAKKDVKFYPFNHQSGAIEYLKHNFANKPVQVKTGRIEIESKDSIIEPKELILI